MSGADNILISMSSSRRMVLFMKNLCFKFHTSLSVLLLKNVDTRVSFELVNDAKRSNLGLVKTHCVLNFNAA